jgi:hypothetical protein
MQPRTLSTSASHTGACSSASQCGACGICDTSSGFCTCNYCIVKPQQNSCAAYSASVVPFITRIMDLTICLAILVAALAIYRKRRRAHTFAGRFKLPRYLRHYLGHPLLEEDQDENDKTATESWCDGPTRLTGMLVFYALLGALGNLGIILSVKARWGANGLLELCYLTLALRRTVGFAILLGILLMALITIRGTLTGDAAGSRRRSVVTLVLVLGVLFTVQVVLTILNRTLTLIFVDVFYLIITWVSGWHGPASHVDREHVIPFDTPRTRNRFQDDPS